MRQLTLNELESKFRDYASNVEFCQISDVKDTLTQLIHFLLKQDISRRILERIEDDYEEIKSNLPSDSNRIENSEREKIIQSLLTPDMQGAFAYFIMMAKFDEERKFTPHYIQSSRDWYDKGKDYYDYQANFNTYFLNPFKDLFLWYIYESKTNSASDFFSHESREVISEQLLEIKEMLKKQGYGQQIIFDEIEELRELTERINKKNWFEVIKGKFIDLAASGLISIETAKKIIKALTGSEMQLLS